MHRGILLGLSALLTVGCISQCPAPATTEYSCELLPAGSFGCSMDPGSSHGRPVGPPPGGGVAPVGCSVILPYCVAFYPDSTAHCFCREETGNDAGGSRRASWVCPL
jgi:hypothetical protein